MTFNTKKGHALISKYGCNSAWAHDELIAPSMARERADCQQIGCSSSHGTSENAGHEATKETSFALGHSFSLALALRV